MSNAPQGFLDRFDPATKDWKMVLFRPGRVIQSSELNEIQSIINNEQQLLGSQLFGEGKIIEGCSVLVDSVAHLVTVSKGKFFALGYVHNIPELTVSITGSGEEVIGLKLTPSVISELEDQTLLDQAVGTDAYGKPGACRLVYSYSLEVNGTRSTKIAVVTDGNLSQVFNSIFPLLDPVMKSMAQRTFETSGNYTVDPYNVSVSDYPVGTSNYDDGILCLVRGGTAYVEGYRSTNGATSLKLFRPLDTADRLDEPVYQSDGVYYYSVDEFPFREVTSMIATIRTNTPHATNSSLSYIPMTRGSVIGGTDPIPDAFEPVVNIVSIVSGGTTYVQGVDYRLTGGGGDNVSWTVPGQSGQQPSPGSSYQLVVDYVKQMEKGIRTAVTVTNENVTRESGNTDHLDHNYIVDITSVQYGANHYTEGTHFTVDKKAGDITWTGATKPSAAYLVSYRYWSVTLDGDFLTRDSFKDGSGNVLWDLTPDYLMNYTGSANYLNGFSLDTGGDKPVTTTIAYITYKYTQGRMDNLLVTTSGQLYILRGKPGTQNKPPKTPKGSLALATLKMPAEARAQDVVISVFNTQTMTMSNLRTMLSEVDKIRYNEAVFQLSADTAKMRTATDKVGVFADNFADMSRMDCGSYRLKTTIDILGRRARVEQTMQEANMTVPDSFFHTGAFFTKPFTAAMIMTQPYATEALQVNAWTRPNMGAKINLDPAQDVWVDSQQVDIQMPDETVTLPLKTVQNYTTVNRVVNHRNYYYPYWGWYYGWYWYGWYWGWYYYNPYYNRTSVSQSTTETYSSSVVNTTEKLKTSVAITPITYARNINVKVKGSRFIPSEDNIVCDFNGKRVALTPVTPTVSGTMAGSVKSDTAGTFTAQFTVPTGTTTGEHELTFTSYDPDTVGSIAQASFSSYGQLKTITTEHTIVRTVQPVLTRTTQTTYTSDRYYYGWYYYYIDPVAQTMSFAKSFFLSGIDLYFVSKPGSGVDQPVELLIVTVQNGIPTGNVLGSVTLQQSQINVGTINVPVATRFNFDNPVYLEKDTDYAFIVKTDDENYSILISKVGKVDPVNGLVTRQPNSGVLLTSANMKTWTPMQDADIKFNLYAARFQEADYTVTFPVVNFATPISRFEFDDNSKDLGEDAQTQWQYSTNNSTWHDFIPPVEVDIKAQTSTLYIRAILGGNEEVSSYMFKEHALRAFLWDSTGCYVARTMDLGNEEARYVDVYSYVRIKSGQTVGFQVDITGTDTYVPMTKIPADTKQIDQEWDEVHYRYDTGSDSNTFSTVKVKADMTTTDKTDSPAIAKFRVIASAI